MILKSYETNKINLKNNKYILFYGKNEGAKSEEIFKLLKNFNQENVEKYDEKGIFENKEIFLENLLSKSLFEKEKIIFVNRVTDKSFTIFEEIKNRDLPDLFMIFNSENLDKRSKLRTEFEKNKNFICIPFYPDKDDSLIRITKSFLKERNISISQANINLIVNKCNGDRGILKNELEKIELFLHGNKKLTNENILKLTNLIENYSISELIDNCLAKNIKKTTEILSENNFNSDDCIEISRIFLGKSKRVLYLSKIFNENKNIEKTISLAKPPIFWKDKEIVKNQILKWNPSQIKKLIYDLNEIELQLKKNYSNSLNIISNFILEKAIN